MSRIKRLEFSKAVKLEMFKRAGGPGDLHCEGCHQPLGGKPFDYDHVIEEWEREDVAHGLRAPLTAADGKLLGKLCCHQPKSAAKTKERAHVYRVIEKAARVKRKSSFPTNRDGRWRKKMNGEVVPR